MANPRESSGLKPEPLIVSRAFPAPRELVFKAWSRADHIKRWFSPEGCSVPEAEVDFRTGGAFIVCMRLPDGVDHWARGTFLEISPPERLVLSIGVEVGGVEAVHRAYGRDLRGRRGGNPHDRAAVLRVSRSRVRRRRGRRVRGLAHDARQARAGSGAHAGRAGALRRPRRLHGAAQLRRFARAGLSRALRQGSQGALVRGRTRALSPWSARWTCGRAGANV